jgi:glutathionyl-hydroquinone reductase
MGVLIGGKWTDGELTQETSQAGQFQRAESIFRDRITADGSSGFKAEPGRYHLYVAHGCPWAHRTLIYRAIKKLDGLISVAYSIPGLKKNGWTFEDDAMRSMTASITTSTMAFTARASQSRRPPMRRPTTDYLQRWTGWSNGCRASAIW